jgi:hypothetical protein
MTDMASNSARLSHGATSIAHFESLLWLLKELEPDGIVLHEHQYHPQSFGSFVVVLGRGHDLAKFVWDGKEFLLSVSFAAVTNKNANVAWAHDANISLPNGHGLFEEIASEAHGALAI